MFRFAPIIVGGLPIAERLEATMIWVTYNSAYCPILLSFGSAGQPPIGVLYVLSTTFTNPALSILSFICSDTSKV